MPIAGFEFKLNLGFTQNRFADVKKVTGRILTGAETNGSNKLFALVAVTPLCAR